MHINRDLCSSTLALSDAQQRVMDADLKLQDAQSVIAANSKALHELTAQ